MKTTENIDAIIFDFGGVIINVDYHKTIRAFEKLGIDDFERLYSQASQSNLFDDIETGRISENEFIENLLDYLPAGTNPSLVREAWNAMVLDIPTERIRFLNELSTRYRLFLLSNTNTMHIDKAYAEWSKQSDIHAQDIFERVYLSHEMGMRKPDAEIFNFVVDQHQLTVERTLFIDDSEQHIIGARNCGLQTLHLTPSQSIISLGL